MAAVELTDSAILPPWTLEGHRNPLAWYMAMHARGHIHRDERSGVWMFLGWHAVRKFLAQPSLWSVAKRNETLDESLRVVRLLTSDPPIHGKLRSYFSRSYRPDRIAQIEERVRIVSKELMANCLSKRSFDVVDDYIKMLAIITICELIGIPESGLEVMSPLTKMVSYLGTPQPAADNPSVLDQLNSGTTVAQSASSVGAYFLELIEKRRVDRQDDLISDLTKIGQDDVDGQVDIPVLLYEQFGAGTNTTVHLFVSLIHELYVQPDLHRRVQKDRSLIVPLIEETLRLHAPLQARPRVLTQDTEINGELVKEGTWGLGWLGAANVDPTIFEDPLKFDIDRPHFKHVTFGWQEHFCLGTHLAKMELRVALSVWLDAIEEFEPLTGREVQWSKDFILHGADRYVVQVHS